MKLTVTARGPGQIRKYRGNVWHVRLPHPDYKNMLASLGDIASERNEHSKTLVAQILSVLYPTKFAAPEDQVETIYQYTEDKLTTIVSGDPEIITKLSKRDIETVAELYAAALKENLFGSKKRDIKLLAESRSASERVYLARVVSQFEEKLTKPSASEASWQAFLRDFILLFNTSYVGALEKLSVTLGGKYPDFFAHRHL